MVSAADANTYDDDRNSNMVCRTEGGIAYTQRFNIDNKFISISGNNQAWRFVYNADGELAKRIDASGTTVFVGNYFERTDPSKRTGQVFVPSTQKSYGSYWKIEATTPSTTKYYFFGGQRVAMRVNDGAPTYLHSDNIGSTSLTTNNGGGLVSQTRYTPFGSIRPPSDTPPTNYTYQSHRSEGFGLSDFSARYYDPVLGRFVSADTVIPNPKNPQNLNRYSALANNPLRFNDPTGHFCIPCVIGLGMLFAGLMIGIPSDVAQPPERAASPAGAVLMVGGAVVAASPAIAAAVAGKACEDGDCTNEINAGNQAVQQGSQMIVKTQNIFQKTWETNPTSGVTVIGRFPGSTVPVGFRELAQSIGANAMKVPDAIWNNLSKAQQWVVNRGFLDNVINRGDAIRLSDNYQSNMIFGKSREAAGILWEDLPGFYRELVYLEKNGYKLVEKLVNGQLVQFMEKQ